MAYVVVAAILLSSSVALGLIVLIGVPVLVLLLGGLIKSAPGAAGRAAARGGCAHRTRRRHRGGLRVLRGIGGEPAFFDRYQVQSQTVRRAGVRVALPQSTLDAAQVFIPGLFVVLVTALGAHFALSGQIGEGELVAFYGYAFFLVLPLRTAAEAVDKITRSLVAGQRMLDVVLVERDVQEPPAPAVEPPTGVPLTDVQSGLVVEPGLLTCLVCAQPDDAAAVADRLGRFTDDGVLLGEVPLADLPLAVVRRRIVVSEADPVLFSGDAAAHDRPLGACGRPRRARRPSQSPTRGT